MKASSELIAMLRAAIAPYQPLGDENMRQRWDMLWCAVAEGRLDVQEFYARGLNDDHIDTALRAAIKPARINYEPISPYLD